MQMAAAQAAPERAAIQSAMVGPGQVYTPAGAFGTPARGRRSGECVVCPHAKRELRLGMLTAT